MAGITGGWGWGEAKGGCIKLLNIKLVKTEVGSRRFSAVKSVFIFLCFGLSGILLLLLVVDGRFLVSSTDLMVDGCGDGVFRCVGGGGEFELKVVDPLGPCVVLQELPPFLARFT